MSAAAHSSVTRYRALARRASAPARQRELLLEGIHLLTEAYASGIPLEHAAFEHQALEDTAVRALADALRDAGTDVAIVSRKTLEAMSPVRTPSGAVGIGRRSLTTIDEAMASATAALVVVACDVQDPGNVGGIVRTAEAAGATAVVAAGATADPFGWKSLRGSMGSALRVPIARASLAATLDAIERARLTATALVPRGGTPVHLADFRAPIAVLLGGEGAGLPPAAAARADHRISIPMRRPVESLNVGIAAALVLYEAFRQREGFGA